MVSRKDVAREAGVSATSVSYYINHSGYVSKASAERIQAAIDKLHYSPNQIAKSLKTQKSDQFLFLCNEIRNPFFAQLISGATAAAYQNNYSILFSNVIDDEEYLRKLCSYQVSGVFLPSGRIRKSVVESILKMGISIVMLSDAVWEKVPDEITTVRSAAENVFPEILKHLKEKGYEKFRYVCSAPDMRRGSIDDKAKAFLQTTQLNPEKDVIYNVTTTEQAGEVIMGQWQYSGVPEAIICANDSIAQGVIYALTQKGIRVPENVGVVGYDNTVASQFYTPSITSVDFGAEKLGEIIIDMLIRRVEGKKVENLEICPVLVPRQSTNRLV